MGHVQSKRKKDKKRHRNIIYTNLSDMVKSVTTGDTDNIHKVAGDRIYRDSVNLEQLSTSSGYFSSTDPSPSSSGTDVEWSSRGDGKGWRSSKTYDVEERNFSTMTPWEELCTYKNIPIDDHPALTKLQNEQNTRLESMEQRMNKIRTNAQQAHERKKFAHLFRAKKEDPETDKLLQEARDMLQRNLEEDKTGSSEYSGEIIPVRIVDDSAKEEQDEDYLPLATFGSLQISEPIMVFILPFLLPLFIIVALIRGMSEIFGWKQPSGRLKSRRSS